LGSVDRENECGHWYEWMLLGKMSLLTAAHRQLAAAPTPVETVHHRGLHRKIDDGALAARPVLS